MYSNTQEALGRFQEGTYRFLEQITADRTPFSMQRWADSLGITRQTLYNYRRRGDSWARFMANTLCVYVIMKTEADLQPGQRPRPQYHYFQLNAQN